MLIVFAVLAAWVVLNVALLGAVAVANHRGQVRAAAPAVSTVSVAAPRRAAAVTVAAR